ncbi:MAG: hypothetical protein DMG37_01685 [Acidobacteria bacterium]|nr:MAG: hypothetical protein DMG37_01685 [Acidobacteriota bacterium]
MRFLYVRSFLYFLYIQKLPKQLLGCQALFWREWPAHFTLLYGSELARGSMRFALAASSVVLGDYRDQ